jgi:hypothetical protein
MRQVADGNDQAAVLPDIVDVAGAQAAHGQVVALGGGDGAGVDRLRRMCSGRYRRDRAGLPPQRGGQV